MQSRSISTSELESVFDYGRIVYTRGAMVYAIGRKEVEKYRSLGLDLSRLNGVQIVCAMDGTVMTAYRNRDFHGLRRNMGRGRYRRSDLGSKKTSSHTGKR